MNTKEGIKRIFLAIGYIVFSFFGWLSASEESNYIISLFGFIVGFYVFKGLLYGINWIIEGFKE